MPQTCAFLAMEFLELNSRRRLQACQSHSSAKFVMTLQRKKFPTPGLIVVPSEWFEGFPMVLQEAFALGTPAAVSEIGPLPSLVKHGQVGGFFTPKDPSSLRAEVERLWSDQRRTE